MPAVFAALSFLLLQATIYVFFPAIAGPTAYVVMVAAPLLAALAAVMRGRRESGTARTAWWALAVTFVVWSAGAFGNLWQELVLGHANEMYRNAMLAFNLAAVPITFLLATEWRPAAGRQLVRAMDGLIALTLGSAYFVYPWAMLTERGAPDDAGVAAMIWLLDAQNLILMAGALVRWNAAQENAERSLFRTLSLYLIAYVSIIFWNNHFVAGDPSTGPQDSSVITLAFAVFASLALSRSQSSIADRRLHAGFVRAVRGASPLLLAGALLILSLFLIRVDYLLGTAGVLIAVLGYGVRNTLSQARHIEREDQLEQTTTALQSIAQTDSLTGLANRRAFDQALANSRHRTGQQMSVLMIDIDHFKQFNDQYGHPAGDACLREVARVMQRSLGRTGDVLARYGGEEFGVVLHECGMSGALVIAERLRAAVESLLIEHAGSPASLVTVSIGVASGITQDEAHAARLVEVADTALYDAKCDGRNRVASVTEDTIRSVTRGRPLSKVG
ncbi:hypothetical protein BH10PSE17_BH10PSE17_26840 [soil metagenome]